MSSQRSLIVDFSSLDAVIHTGGSGFSASVSGRAQLYAVVFDGILRAAESGVPRRMLTIKADPTAGEGVLFRAISADIARMVEFEVDAISDTEGIGQDLAELMDRYRPSEISVPVVLTDWETVDQKGRRRLRANYARAYETTRGDGIGIAWDLHLGSDPGHDAVELAIRFITWAQDRGLDPPTWICDLPRVQSLAWRIVERVNIDDRSGVETLFRLSPARDDAIRIGSSDAAEPDRIVAFDGHALMVVGADRMGDLLRRHLDGASDADATARAIGDALVRLASTLDREFAAT